MERINFNDYDLTKLQIVENIACEFENYSSYHITFILPKQNKKLHITVINDSGEWRLGQLFQVLPTINYSLDREQNEKLLSIFKELIE
ncbi:hypothetical protein bcere0029_54390 [Bacillus cereus AH1272]|nr:hypothetical protein bcere0029_54390 [Bacillus cereus AH1272]